MSISDRLDQIEQRCDEGLSDRVSNYDAPDMLAALRAVLDYADYHDDEGWSAWPDGIRAAIERVLGGDTR